MKKVLLGFVLGLFLIGCGGEEDLAAKEDNGYIAVLDAEDVEVRFAALIADDHPQYILEQVAREDPEWGMRMNAVLMLEDQDILCDIAQEDESVEVRDAALRRLTREEDIADVATYDEDERIRLTAILKIKSAETLQRIASETPFEDTRETAEINARLLKK